MKKVIVTLRGAPAETFEIPEGVERSCFGSLRLFPGVPRAISAEEREHLKKTHVEPRLNVRPYVESRRVDKRGATESEIVAAAEKAGVSHLPMQRQIEVLLERGVIKPPVEKKSEPAPKAVEDKSKKPAGK